MPDNVLLGPINSTTTGSSEAHSGDEVRYGLQRFADFSRIFRLETGFYLLASSGLGRQRCEDRGAN